MNGTSAQYCNLRTREGEILKIPFFPADQEAIDALIQHVQGSGAHHDGEAEDKREYTIHGRRNGKTAIFFAFTDKQGKTTKFQFEKPLYEYEIHVLKARIDKANGMDADGIRRARIYGQSQM